MGKLERLLTERSRAAQAVAFDTSGALELTGAVAIPAAEIVAIRDVWSVLGRELGAGELRELSCTDGAQLSLFLSDSSGRTVALVEQGGSVETLGEIAQEVATVIAETAKDRERVNG
jgi:hypothetical protein